MEGLQFYEIAPSDEVFSQIKNAAIAVWSGYDDTHGYATDKIMTISGLSNFGGNWGTMIGMFDLINQEKLVDRLSGEARDLVERAIRPNMDAIEDLKNLGFDL